MALVICLGIQTLAGAARTATLVDTGRPSSDPQTIIIEGVGAERFQIADWQTSAPPNLVPDVRHPLLEPRSGKFQNIYAPSLVHYQGEWTIYYGGWDGIPEGHDHIYATTTKDFLTFGPRSTVIEPEGFQHVCNVNAQLDFSAPPAVNMMVTVYPDSRGLNKPALFHLAQLVPSAPVKASRADIINIKGYTDYPGADINGMNVLLQDGPASRLYFGDFRNYRAVHTATIEPGTTATFNWQSEALGAGMGVNDVKILKDDSGLSHYLMGLHTNSNRLYYSLSNDPKNFSAARPLLKNRDDADRYITSMGFTCENDSGEGSRRVIGLLYGAGAKSSLDANRIFARWLQVAVEFSSADADTSITVAGALGPDNLVVRPGGDSWSGVVRVSAPAGKPWLEVRDVILKRGRSYRLEKMATESDPK